MCINTRVTLEGREDVVTMSVNSHHNYTQQLARLLVGCFGAYLELNLL